MPHKHLMIDDGLHNDAQREGARCNEAPRDGGQRSEARSDLRLFEDTRQDRNLGDGAVLLAGFAKTTAAHLLGAIADVAAAAPFRQMVTRGGHRMSVAMTNCGVAGWVSDRTGYRYDLVDPATGAPWPAMPAAFCDLAYRAAMRASFADFAPDVCLLNRYERGARMALHQDRDERAFDAPIVSVSLGLPATFLFGGATRSEPRAASRAAPRRRRRLGRTRAPPLPRHHAAAKRQPPHDRPHPPQFNAPPSILGCSHTL